MLNNIQMLRAVAAFMVFFYHALHHYIAMGGACDLCSRVGAFGYAGVDIFFVISGFVAALSTFDKPRTLTSAQDFARRRFLRIYLGYWPFMALALILTFIFEPAKVAQLDLAGSFFLTSVQHKQLVLAVSWSLAFELIFYILFTVSLLMPVRVLPRLIYLLVVADLAILFWTRESSQGSTLLFLSMFFEFLMGTIIFIHRAKFTSRAWLVPCGIVAFLAYWAGVHLNATDGSVRIFTFGIGALALFMVALLLEQTRIWIAGRTWVSVGDASYTVYLFHLPLILLFFFTGARGYLATLPAPFREGGFLLYLAGSLWLCHLVYVRLERPLYRWSLSLTAKSQMRIPAIVNDDSGIVTEGISR